MAEVCSEDEGCACSGASTTAEPPEWELFEGVMVSRLDSLRAELSSNNFIASIDAFVRNACGTWCSGLLAWSLVCVEAGLADDPRTIPANSKPRLNRYPSTITTASEGCQTRNELISSIKKNSSTRHIFDALSQQVTITTRL